jgi:Na+-transporting NADH:ubiquinone oxidoreductase subunit F
MATKVNIVVNDKIHFNASTSISLFSALNQNGIFLPSICGGRGICGKCKCRVLEGAGKLQPAEVKKLSKIDIENSYRLACQVIIENDIKLAVPESVLQEKAYEAKVQDIHDLTSDIKRIRIQLVNPSEIRFRPGQYVQLQSRPYGNITESVMRSYSIASSKETKARIDLMVRLVPEGICSTWVHRHLKEGDRVAFVGPRGDFFLRKGSEPVIMVAGGSGMAPMVSMLHELSDTAQNREIRFFFGACREKDLYYLDVMEDFARRMPAFRFIPVLSNPEQAELCRLETGLVTEPFEKFMKQRESPAAGFRLNPFISIPSHDRTGGEPCLK